MLLKISQILQENTFRAATLLKKRAQQRFFPIELVNILIIPVLVLWMQYIVDGSDEGLIILPSNVLTDK